MMNKISNPQQDILKEVIDYKNNPMKKKKNYDKSNKEVMLKSKGRKRIIDDEMIGIDIANDEKEEEKIELNNNKENSNSIMNSTMIITDEEKEEDREKKYKADLRALAINAGLNPDEIDTTISEPQPLIEPLIQSSYTLFSLDFIKNYKKPIIPSSIEPSLSALSHEQNILNYLLKKYPSKANDITTIINISKLYDPSKDLITNYNTIFHCNHNLNEILYNLGYEYFSLLYFHIISTIINNKNSNHDIINPKLTKAQIELIKSKDSLYSIIQEQIHKLTTSKHLNDLTFALESLSFLINDNTTIKHLNTYFNPLHLIDSNKSITIRLYSHNYFAIDLIGNYMKYATVTSYYNYI